MNRVGRPRDELDPAQALITRRVRRLVDAAHGGNVLEASNVTGVPAATLRALYNGKSTNPGLRTLDALSRPYGLAPGWFSEDETHTWPRMGLDITFRVKQPDGTHFNQRHVGIPWSSWPFPGVYWKLRNAAVGAAGPERPIIGRLDPANPTESLDIDAAIARFLLAPLLAIEEQFEVELLPAHSQDTADAAKSQRLRSLGQFWQEALAPMFAE